MCSLLAVTDLEEFGLPAIPIYGWDVRALYRQQD